MNEKDALIFARAFVDLYSEIDGVVDEMSARDFRLTQKHWPLYLAALALLEGTSSPEEVSCG